MGRIFLPSAVSKPPGEAMRAAAEQMLNACVLEFLTAEQGAAGQLLARCRT